MSEKHWNFFVAVEKWQQLKKEHHLKAVLLQENNGILLLSMDGQNAQQYTCFGICPLRRLCPSIQPTDRPARFQRQICEIAKGPISDSLITGRIG